MQNVVADIVVYLVYCGIEKLMQHVVADIVVYVLYVVHCGIENNIIVTDLKFKNF